jgi:hypothetical protein
LKLLTILASNLVFDKLFSIRRSSVLLSPDIKFSLMYDFGDSYNAKTGKPG